MAAGTSYQRPPSARAAGAAYYDSTLGKFVDSNGTYWQDRAGNQIGNLLTVNEALQGQAVSGYWSPTNATVARSRSVVPTGRMTSLQITSSASGDLYALVTRGLAVTAGTTYSVAVRSFQAVGTARNFYPAILWHPASSTNFGTALSSGSGVWTTANVLTATAPASQTTASIGVYIVAAAASNEIFYATEVCFSVGTITDYMEP
jgi:hypothetical protein